MLMVKLVYHVTQFRGVRNFVTLAKKKMMQSRKQFQDFSEEIPYIFIMHDIE